MLKTFTLATALLAMPLFAEGLKGRVYQDINGNGTFEKTIDKKLQYVNVTVVDSNGTTVHTQTNKYGIYKVTGIATGQALITIDEASIVHDTTTPFLQVDGFNPSTKVVRAGKANWSGRDGYSFTSVPTATVCGYVRNNDNFSFNPLSTPEPNILVSITNSDPSGTGAGVGGTVYHTRTNSEGRYCANVDSRLSLPHHPIFTISTQPGSRVCNGGIIAPYVDVYGNSQSKIKLLFNTKIHEVLPLLSLCRPFMP